MRAAIFFSPALAPAAADVEVRAVEDKLVELFAKLKLQRPASATAKEVYEWTCVRSNGVCYWDGDGGSTDTQMLCAKIVQAVREAEGGGLALAQRSRGVTTAAAAPDACTCPLASFEGAL